MFYTYVCAYKYATKEDEADALLPLLTSAAMSSAAAVDDFSPIRALLNVLHSLCLSCLLPPLSSPSLFLSPPLARQSPHADCPNNFYDFILSNF